MNRQSLKLRLGLFIVTLVTLLLLGFAYYGYHNTQTTRSEQINASIERLSKRLQLSLPGPLWNYEKGFVESAIRSEMNDPSVAMILISNEGKLISGFRKDDDGTIRTLQELPKSLPEGILTQPLIYQDGDEKNRVGQADLLISDALLKSELRSLLIRSLVQALVLDVVIIFILMSLMHSNVLKPLHHMNSALSELAQGGGDLTHRLKIKRLDEVGTLGASTNQFLEKLQQIIRDIKGLSAQVRSSAQSSQTHSQANVRGIEAQQSELDQVATAVTQMTSAVEEVARNATQTSQVTDEASSFVNRAAEVSHNANQAIGKLVTDIQQVASLTESLAEESNEIDKVIEVINAIAEQTNLLALNAAIEAARAGEMGRGFAVVADEVRVLASRTRNSTEEIRTIIGRLQEATGKVVHAMGQSCQYASDVGRESEDVQHSVSNINEKMNKVREMNIYIAQAAEEQHSVAESINKSVTRIAQLNHENTQSISIGQQEIDKLNQLSAQLDRLIDRFSV
ncbi:methyl-accepting chemotaxis protein [Atopomonas hussainii]|uniref:Methyl-accepting chemotaxis protein n=1 Tax=Atopomonas hussainii TaxID=1429083 RepID=A0A1H7NHD1_9GAMM|nr:methyl-accepting chemotaxis protein [Atopomonas hussainii]SEL22814.1 methyl-accepting chemotaxis protein [Atopomonas hussainii]